ncbi:MAG: peptidoglycan DD-metalloendopeptidase family protein [Ignavibacteriales bacterium]|nr:peptidoglycan DD-metalloendopeptidase family protein [Ignavibacteriales bacterium]
MNKNLLFVVFFFSCLSAQTFRLSRPVPDNIEVNGSYLYGEPRFGNSSLAHTGIDIALVYDTVRSAAGGTVTFVGYNPSDTVGGYEPGGCGNYIYLQTTWNAKTVYLLHCHLKKPIVTQGAIVVAGQPIAISGTTGNSTGPHLHFEIRVGTTSPSAQRSRRNAELWFAMQGTGAIYGKVPSAANSTRVNISPDPKPRPPYTTYGYSLTYNFNDPAIGSDDIYNENYAIGDVKPGTYTITTVSGTYNRVVTVKANEVVNADPATSVNDEGQSLPQTIALDQNYPNPFNPTTMIGYQLSSPSHVILKVYDILGKEVSELVNGRQTAGAYEIPFSSYRSADRSDCCGGSSQLPSGVYVYRLTAQTDDGQSVVLQKKMMLVK